MSASAQNVAKNEAKQLQAFLSQPAVAAATNAEALRVSNPKDIASIEGVKVENGHVTAIDWKGKKLAGTLDLKGFTALTKVDVSRNALAGLDVDGATALTELNASRNRLTDFAVTDAPALVKMSINNNRLTDLNITGTPALKNLNCSSNYFVALDMSGAPALVTLN